MSLGISDTAAGAAGVKDVFPLGLRQGSPAAVLLVAAVDYRIVAPVSLTIAVIQVIIVGTVGIVVAIIGACTPRLVADGTVVIAA